MRKYSLGEAIDIGAEVTDLASVLVGTVVMFVIGVILIKLLWAWTIPDLFPLAVAQGLIAVDLTFLTTMKAVALVAILSSVGRLIAGQLGR